MRKWKQEQKNFLKKESAIKHSLFLKSNIFFYYSKLFLSYQHRNGGQGGIRTHGRFYADSFQDCCLNPLDHLSIMAETMRFELMDIAKHRRFSKPLQSTTLPRLRVYKIREIMVRPTGFEPATNGLEIRCSSFELWA